MASKKDKTGTETFEEVADTRRNTSSDSANSTVKVEIPGEDGNGALVIEQRGEPGK